MNWCEQIDYFGDQGARALEQARADEAWQEWVEGL